MSSTHSTHAPLTRYHLQLVGMAVLWGASWAWARYIVQSMPPLTGGALRFLIASLTLLLWMFLTEGPGPLLRLRARQWLGLTAASAFGVFGYASFFMLALQYVPASKASTVVALNPVLPLVLGAFFFQEKLNRGIVAGMALAIIGALTAIARGNPLAILTGGVGTGEYLLLATVLCWTGYTMIGRVVLQGISPLVTTLGTAIVGTLMLTITASISEGPGNWATALNAPAPVWFSLIGLAVGATSVAYLWYFAGIQHLGVGTAASYMVLVPIFGILISTLWLGEDMHPSLLIGAALVVGGMWQMNRARRQG
ncbi:MAG: DMT family transporter [Lautropia sp.]|nr:DMT family transporter [Lautropia sp.]